MYAIQSLRMFKLKLSRKKVIIVTVRTLESLIRLSTAFAKARLSQKAEKKDAEQAFDLLLKTIFQVNEEKEDEEEDNKMDLVEEEEDDKRKKKSKKKEKKEEIIPLEEDERGRYS